MSTSGKGDPYWYEWTVGLLKVVEMLHPDSTIESVSFQVAGVKGWDDVVVRYSGGRADYLQIKHSRVGRDITFGDLVAADEKGESLLTGLFSAWREMKLRPGASKCILLTNRHAGEATGISSSGVKRPPLLAFIAWLQAELGRAKSLGRCRPPNEWSAAWDEWRATLASGTRAQRLAFVRAFEIHSNQEGLKDLELSVLQNLSELFQVSLAKTRPLLHALDNALRRWTTEEKAVTAEDAFSAMALDPEAEIENRAPPPPAPFFSSREAVLRELEDALKAPHGSPIVFLCAEPGAGKTSVVSQLANRRVGQPLQGAICLRYFAFRPITPDSPLIPPDADHFVRADRLWFSLLSQLRRGLKGKLRAYQVPLRDHLLEWPEARAHVLRLAKRLGVEMRRPFTIAIDGIDHAARAMRCNGSQAKGFFDSLPGPDEIGDSPVRIMVAGQPQESYPEYPAWLRAPNPKVQTLGIGKLESADIRVLMRAAKSLLPAELEEAALHEIATATDRNTLAVVFAVEESRTCHSAEELRGRLADRRLGDGLQQYYSAIWRHAVASVGSTPVGTTVALATALCATPERLTGSLMASAFRPLGLTREQWQVLLAKLGPLVVKEAEGYRVLHNDVRVFLQGQLAAEPLLVRQQGAAFLADYYLSPESNRWFAHKAVLRLLRDAGREAEWARVFTVDWVLEATALGIPCGELSGQCAQALLQGAALRNWDVMHELACATETVGRWEEACELKGATRALQDFEFNPKPLDSELFVRPLAEWTVTDLTQLAEDADFLTKAREVARARSLLDRWLKGLSVVDLCRKVRGLVDGPSAKTKNPRASMGERRTFELLGAACRACHFNLKSCKPATEAERTAELEVELGWIRASCNAGPFDSVEHFLAGGRLKYLSGLRAALDGLASHRQWALVRLLMNDYRKACERLGAEAKAQATWWAVASQASIDHPGFLDVLSSPRFGLPDKGEVSLRTAFSLCRSLGWTKTGDDPSSISRRVLDALPQGGQRAEEAGHYLLLFRAAATLGQVASCISRRGMNAAADILPPRAVAQLMAALWGYQFHEFHAHENAHHAGELASDLVALVFEIGGEHRKALLEAAKPSVEKYPVSWRLPSLWDLHKRTGDIPRLRAWLKHWLAEDGWLWREDGSSRDDIAERLLPLARDVGETDLACEVEEKLRWLQIRYSGHKEYSFYTPLGWLQELCEFEPKCWRDSGLRLWTLAEACSAQGGDDRSAWQLGEALGAAAWACGPGDVWELLTADYADCGTEKWLFPTANRIVAGFTEYLRRRQTMSRQEKLAGWCLAVGLSRWFNDGSVKSLAELRTALLETALTETEKSHILSELARLTPGEARRNPRPEQVGTVPPSERPEEKGLLAWVRLVEEEGAEVDPQTAARLLRETLARMPDSFTEVARKILRAVGVGGAYDWAFHAHGNKQALAEIARISPGDLLWELVDAAVRYAGDGARWSFGISGNLQHILLARAKVAGVPSLRKGLDFLLSMHEKWARGGRGDLGLPTITLGPTKSLGSVGELAAHGLTFLLGSRSAEVIESALNGIHALAAVAPGTLCAFLTLAEGDAWKQHWVLNSAETWAALFPTELEKKRALLESWLMTGPFYLRLQAWIVLHTLAHALGQKAPGFPCTTAEQPKGESGLLQPARAILATAPLKRGSFNFIDRFHAVESTIEHVETVTGADLQRLRSEVATKLMDPPAERTPPEHGTERMLCSGDTKITGLSSTSVLDAAFDDLLRRSPLPPHLEGALPQAYLTGEDPWITRHSPLPDDDQSAWPTEEELGGGAQKPLDLVGLRQKLYLLVSQHQVPADEAVIAGRAQVFTWRDDYVFLLWSEEGTDETREVSSHRCPTTMNGRTFALFLGSWWEPQIPLGKRPLAFAVGAQRLLHACCPDFFPARLWVTEFGWKPSPLNPLLWLENSEPVARYERIHGVPRFTHSGHPRQPLLGRWLVRKSSWGRLSKERGPFRMFDDFQRFSSDVEH